MFYIDHMLYKEADNSVPIGHKLPAQGELSVTVIVPRGCSRHS